MKAWRLPVLRAVLAALFAGLWIVVPLLLAVRTGRSGPAWALAAGLAAWSVFKATGWEAQVPDLDQIPAARVLAAFLFLSLLLAFAAKGGIWGVLLFGFVLGLLPLTPAVTAVSVLLSLGANAVLLERLGGPLWVRCAWGTVYVSILLAFIQMHQWVQTRDDPADFATLRVVALWGIGLLPLAAGTAYLLTATLHLTHPWAGDPRVISARQVEPTSSRDLILFLIVITVFLLFWRRLAALLERRLPRTPGLDARTVFGEPQARPDLAPRSRSVSRKGVRGQLVTAFLDFFDFLSWHGFPRQPGTPADVYLEAVGLRIGDVADRFQRASAVFDRVRYGEERISRNEAVQSRRELRELRQAVVAFYTTRESPPPRQAPRPTDSASGKGSER